MYKYSINELFYHEYIFLIYNQNIYGKCVTTTNVLQYLILYNHILYEFSLNCLVDHISYN